MSVMLPTYRRPEVLRGCLAALLEQTHAVNEIVVGRRVNDTASAEAIAEAAAQPGARVIEAVVGPDDNLVASMNAALQLTTGDLVALTDDDAEAPADWLARLAEPFDDPVVGGVGGRDIQRRHQGEASVVGKLQWFGRLIGNHHLAVGPVRSVDVLKGVNCCFRGDALREIGFDRRLRGRGNVSHWELGVCFAFKRRGFDLVFDPSLTVLHHVADRHDGDTNCRGGFNGPAHADAVHNETLLVAEHLGMPRRLAYATWALTVGSGAAPGALQAVRLMVRGSRPGGTMARCFATWKGRATALTTLLNRPRETATPSRETRRGGHTERAL